MESQSGGPRARSAAGALAIALLGGCASGQVASDAVEPAEILGPCPVSEGVRGGLCGELLVEENRDDPDGVTIPLKIVVLPATEPGGAPDPLFILAGGPGQAATDLAVLFSGVLGEIRQRRDVVFVDQRGTGERGPLTCDLLEGQLAFADSVPLEVTEEDWRACLAAIEARPDFYTTPVAMDDLEEVRRALGYGRINLWGGSYGTRAASVFLRRHPDSVRTAILDGVAPVDMQIPLHFPSDAQRALDQLTGACAADPDCAARFPGLASRIAELLDSLDHDPPRRFRVRHPRTGEWEEIPFPRETAAAVLRAALYSPTTSALAPLMVESALDGDFGPLLTLADPAVGPDLSLGMFLSVLCAEDIPWVDREQAFEAAGGALFDTVAAEQLIEACSVWPRGELPAGYREPVRSDAPVLVLSGELDPVTPPRWGEHAAETLSNARHLVVPGAAHGTLAVGCVPDLIREFLDTVDPAGLDASCLDGLVRPRFWFTGTGPGGSPPEAGEGP